MIPQFICKIIGHKWRNKDYTFWIKENGDQYPFKASRKCSCCKEYQYLDKEWKTAIRKSPYDLEKDAHSVKKLVLN